MGYFLINVHSGDKSQIFATAAEAEKERLEEVEANLVDDIEYLSARLADNDYSPPSDPDSIYLESISRDPGSIQDIARQRALHSIFVCFDNQV